MVTAQETWCSCYSNHIMYHSTYLRCSFPLAVISTCYNILQHILNICQRVQDVTAVVTCQDTISQFMPLTGQESHRGGDARTSHECLGRWMARAQSNNAGKHSADVGERCCPCQCCWPKMLPMLPRVLDAVPTMSRPNAAKFDGDSIKVSSLVLLRPQPAHCCRLSSLQVFVRLQSYGHMKYV